jgi:hypothetical protein
MIHSFGKAKQKGIKETPGGKQTLLLHLFLHMPIKIPYADMIKQKILIKLKHINILKSHQYITKLAFL